MWHFALDAVLGEIEIAFNIATDLVKPFLALVVCNLICNNAQRIDRLIVPGFLDAFNLVGVFREHVCALRCGEIE